MLLPRQTPLALFFGFRNETNSLGIKQYSAQHKSSEQKLHKELSAFTACSTIRQCTLAQEIRGTRFELGSMRELQRLKRDSRIAWQKVKGFFAAIPKVWRVEVTRAKRDTQATFKGWTAKKKKLPAAKEIEKKRFQWHLQDGLDLLEGNPILIGMALRYAECKSLVIAIFRFCFSFSTLIWFFTALGLYLRLKGIGGTPLWFTEQTLWLDVLGPRIRTQDSFLTLHIPYMLMWLFEDTGNLLLRLPGAVAGGFCSYALARLCAWMGSKPAGVTAAALVALSPYYGVWTSTAGPFGLMTLATILVLFAFLYAREVSEQIAASEPVIESIRWGSWKPWGVYGLAVLFLSNTHASFPLIITGLVVAYTYECFFSPRPHFWREWVLFIGASIAGSLFALAYMPNTGLFRLALYPTINFIKPIKEIAADFLLFLGPTPLTREYDPLLLSLLGGICVVFFLLALFLENTRQRAMIRLLAIAFLVTLVMTFDSLGKRADWAWGRFVPHIVIYLFLFIPFGCMTFSRLHPKAWSVPALALISCYVCFGLEWNSRTDHFLGQTTAMLKSHQKGEITHIEGFILQDSKRVTSEFGRIYRGTKPVYLIGHSNAARRDLNNQLWSTHRLESRGSIEEILQRAFAVEHLKPGSYLITPLDAEFRCEALLGGNLGKRVPKTRWQFCSIPASTPRTAQKQQG